LGIYQRGKIWWIDYYYKGRRLREPVSASRQEATAALKARSGDIVKGRFELKREAKDCRFEEFAVVYAKHLKATRRGWRKELSKLKVLVRHFGSRMLGDVTTYDVECFKAERKKTMAGATVNRDLALLKTMYNKAAQWKFFRGENPVRGVGFFAEQQKERILSDEEARRLVESSTKSLKPVVIVALNTGMRMSEILGLRWENVDFTRRFIFVERSKNGRSRKVPMNSEVLKTLAGLQRNGNEFVFPKERSSGPLRSVRTAFLNALRKAKIANVRFHDLRHTFATNLVMNGVDLVTVKEILGHSEIAMTVRYSHPSDSRKMDAVERLVTQERSSRDALPTGEDGHNLVTKGLLPENRSLRTN
jgi:integrase